ncbi:hypothetical protein QCM80_22120 [Bradyrhizobium sp. SSUT112]|uniref:hypothetical protein n=1 Tax=Bradyrhizobium sp. SSUT112 TaxID=3040604 RepID=UPI00244A416C|nr:hypothetical protein [Bradyrhizobium sp. SSUT112]MDH2353334.1 hypothetical protein [Bradyrhizobium sp. SSUT112]
MKTTVPLKPIRLENDDRQELEVCPKCYGGGTHHRATCLVDDGNGGTRQQFADIRKGDIKGYKKEGWVVHQSPCSHCKGAGMSLVEPLEARS